MTCRVAIALLLATSLTNSAMALEPDIPANERPEIIIRHYINAPYGYPPAPLNRVIVASDYLPRPPAATYISIDTEPVNTALSPTPPDFTRAIRIK